MQAKQQNHNKIPKPNPPLNVRETLTRVFLLTFLCSLFYVLPSLITNSINPISQCPNAILFNFSSITASSSSTILDFQTHHTISLPSNTTTVSILEPKSFFKFCDKNFIDYCPCHDPPRQMNELLMRKMFYLERICPVRNKQRSRCLTPSPVGYRTPFLWPESKKFAWFENVPSKELVIAKKVQNWVRLEGDRLVFPGGGTSFKMGVKNYIDGIKRVIPLQSGSVRTVLDVGCGVASFGAALMDYDILTMSIAPRDRHEAQVQFALERGLPAMLGILSIHRLPYPSRSFDMVHCSRCLVPWTDYDGLYLMEIDRILRPGGYWVLSGPPISWKISYKGWERPTKELEQEQAALEDLAKRLCWKKIAEKGAIAVWRKPTNHVHCIKMSKTWKFPHFCNATDSDDGWYRAMEPCITPLPKVKDIKGISGGALEKWPRRLNADPQPRIKSGISKEITVQTIYGDNKMWNHRVLHYGRILASLAAGKYRNIMDMNARLGGFAAALSKYQVWVMNVVPFDATPNTLSVIYDRGLIGTYMNWCEAFSTYPRTYDLIHADGIFSMYMDKCDIVDILFEMHRILRPKGAVIIRDNIDIIVQAKAIAERMRWKCKIQNSEHGPNHPEKILFVDNSASMYP